MKKISLALASLFAATTASLAADLPSRTAPPMAPAPTISQMTFSGFYVGISGGWAQAEFKDKDSSGSLRGNGGLLGLTLGYNYLLTDRFVLGLEGDVSWMSARKKQTVVDQWTGGYSIGTGRVEQTFFATIRPRLGYTFGNWMPYITGGLAIADTKLKYSDASYVGTTLVFSEADSVSKTRTGWTIGGGVEVLLTQNLSAKLEYLYADFGSTRYHWNNGFSTGKVSIKDNIVRAGVNYRF